MDHLSHHINESIQPSGTKQLRIILVIGMVYCITGVISGILAGQARSHTMVVVWRLASWLVCSLIFASHILWQHYRFNYSPGKTALHTSSAAAIGAFGLAVAANIHAQSVHSDNRLMLGLSLAIWPVLVMVPAFIAAFVLAFLLQHFRKFKRSPS